MLAVSPTLIVALHPPPHSRQGRKLVGWVPGARNRVLISAAHAVVLAEVLSGKSSEVGANAITWAASVKALGSMGVCTEGARGPVRWAPFDAPIARRADDVSPTFLKGSPRLELLWNFAMRPGPEGFLAFSAQHRCYVLLPPAAVAVLVSFVNPAIATEVVDAEGWIPWLWSHGLLVDADLDRGDRVVQTQLADLRAECTVERQGLPEETARMGAAMTAPRTVSDPRVPVYCISTTTDLEARSQLPLGMGMILAHARTYQGGVLQEAYRFLPDILLSPAAVREAVERNGPGVVLFSDHIWTVDSHMPISRALKAASHETITVHGGPSLPVDERLASQFLTKHEHIDVAVHGEGEMTAAELLQALAPCARKAHENLHLLRDVPGLTYRDSSAPTGFTRTAPRARAVDVNVFPSPYLTGVFDGIAEKASVSAILETNRGCPYGCTYCDWGLGTLQKIRSFDLDRVRSEIEWIADHQIPIVWGADANFGILDRDIEIARTVADARRRRGFPRQFLMNYAKNATARLSEITRILRDADISAEGILAIQTTDPATLSIIGRSNIKVRKYDELLDLFRQLKLPVSTDLLIGLPGSTVESFARDLQHCIDRRVPAKAYRTRVLVNSLMADVAYREKYRIETDANDDIVSSLSFTREDLGTMNRLYDAYRLYETSGVLFYVLRYLQWDHGLEATEVLGKLVQTLAKDPGAYPAMAWVDRYWQWNLNVGGYRPFYEDVARYLEEQHGITPSRERDAVLRAQEAVIREPGRSLPETVTLTHDVVAWFQDHLAGKGALLRRYPPGSLTVSDPDDLCGVDLSRQRQYDTHFVRWELASPLRAADSVPLFLDQG